MNRELIENGYVIVENVLDSNTLAKLCEAFAAPVADGAGGIRNVLRDVAIASVVAKSTSVRSLVTEFLGDDCFAVRGILFDKTADGANWKVPYHQDLSIAVSERPTNSLPGWGPWTEKAGVAHMQPPIDVLKRMCTVRLHLDTCDKENGPLRVLPGSQSEGRLSAERIVALRETLLETVCTVPAGGAVVMSPLILHASSPVTIQQPGSRRRVLHIEYVSAEIVLPEGLEWYERVAP